MSPHTKNILVGAATGFMLAASPSMVVLFLDKAPEINAYIFGEKYKGIATFIEVIGTIGATVGALFAASAADD